MSRTQLIVIVSAIGLLVFVMEQVRRRRLREEYAWLWLLTVITYLAVAVWPELLVWTTEFIGASNPVSVFAFLGLLFLLLISIQYSMQLSELKGQSKDLAQQLAILDSEIVRLSEVLSADEAQEVASRGEDLARQVASLQKALERLSQTIGLQTSVGQRLEEHASAE